MNRYFECYLLFLLQVRIFHARDLLCGLEESYSNVQDCQASRTISCKCVLPQCIRQGKRTYQSYHVDNENV